MFRSAAIQAYGQDAELDEEMDSQYHAIPHNVVEQLHMWEQEENRLNDKPAALFKDCFANEIEYNRCIEFCKVQPPFINPIYIDCLLGSPSQQPICSSSVGTGAPMFALGVTREVHYRRG